MFSFNQQRIVHYGKKAIYHQGYQAYPECCSKISFNKCKKGIALEQGITVIAVKDKKNILENDISILPWKKNQLHFVRMENL